QCKIEHRWLLAIYHCMKLDCLLSDQTKFLKKAIKKSLVLMTWQGMLQKESSLPEDWTRESEVLVGIIK
ncbi:hypothetical protein ARMGADRAFT_936933, partial [Armillaria gallica]